MWSSWYRWSSRPTCSPAISCSTSSSTSTPTSTTSSTTSSSMPSTPHCPRSTPPMVLPNWRTQTTTYPATRSWAPAATRVPRAPVWSWTTTTPAATPTAPATIRVASMARPAADPLGTSTARGPGAVATTIAKPGDHWSCSPSTRS